MAHPQLTASADEAIQLSNRNAVAQLLSTHSLIVPPHVERAHIYLHALTEDLNVAFVAAKFRSGPPSSFHFEIPEGATQQQLGSMLQAAISKVAGLIHA